MAVLLLAVSACGGDGSSDPVGPSGPSTIELSPSAVSFDALGETQQLTATVLDEEGTQISGAAVSWLSSHLDVATVSSGGLVTAVSVGSARITAVSGAASGTSSVAVQQIASAIEVSPGSLELEGPHDTATAVVSVTDAGGSPIVDPKVDWATDDEGVATVTDAGLVTAVGSGTTTLTAKAGDSGVGTSVGVRVDEGVLAGPAGGEISVAGGGATLDFPSGALSDLAFVTAAEATDLPEGAAPLAAYDFGPDGLLFSEPVRLTMEYDPADLASGETEAYLGLYKLGGGSFEHVNGSIVDEMSHSVSGEIRGFSVYAILEQLAITTESLPDGVVGATYYQVLASSGHSGGYVWSVAAGALPSGLSLTRTGVIVGTPTEPGASNFTVQVTSGGQTAQRTFSIAVNHMLSVTSSALPEGVVGSAYEAALTAVGGNGSYEWGLVEGALPPGLELSTVTGVIAGTPNTPGPSSFTVRVTSGSLQAERALSISVYAVLGVVTSSLPNGAPETPYEVALQATGGDGSYTWSVGAGALPGGLNLNPSTGVISGTPSGSGSTFTIQVESGDGQTDTAVLTIDVSAGLAVFTGSLPAGVVGAEYSEALVATGGDGTYDWELVAGTLPSGLSLGADGAIDGTPTTAGTSNFIVEVSSGGQTAQRELSIVVHAHLTITTTSLPDGALGESYSQNLAAIGGSGSYSWTVASGSLPNGLALSSGGQIDGTPTGAGTSNFTVQVTDGTQTAQEPMSIFVAGPPETVTNLTVIDQTPTTLTIRFTEVDDGLGGPADYAVRHAVSPIDWASADGSQQIVQGTQVGLLREVVIADLEPNTQYDVQLVAFRGTPDVDAVHSEDRSNIATGSTLPIPVALTTSYLVGGYPSTAYSDAITPASGGDGSYAYVVSEGTLPAGLSLNSTTGEISGTATGTGMSFFEITATSAGQSASALYSLTISTQPPGAFNLWGVNIAGNIPASNVGNAVDEALARWEATVTGDIGSVTIPESASGFCSLSEDLTGLLKGAFVDDVLVLVNIDAIDGPGGTAAQAGPCIVVQVAPQTVVGRLTLDAEDLVAFSEAQAFETIWHEIGHVMGIGSLWGALLSGDGTVDPRFLGTAANAEYFALGGTLGSIPVEEGFGPGTAYGHWDEGFFDDEAMTGFLESGAEPISRMTIASLADIGWTVSYAAADSYSLPPCSPFCSQVTSGTPSAVSGYPRFELAPDWEIGVIPGRR